MSSADEFPCPSVYWLKMAVAIAIIRTKPSDVSARKYAEHLQSKFIISQSNLQEQYLKTRMQLAYLQHTLAFSNKNINGMLKVLKQLELFNPLSSNVPCCYILSAGSETHLFQHEDISSSKKITEEFHPVDVVFSNMLRDSAALNGKREAVYAENTMFIQSMITLANLEKEYPSFENSNLVETAKISIRTISDIISRNIMTVSEACLCQAAHSVTSTIENFTWLEDHPDFMQEVCMLVERIIAQLVHPSNHLQLNVRRQQHLMVSMLLVLMNGKCLSLTSSILESLVESLETFCHRLRQSQLSQDPIDPDMFDNGYFLLYSLELIMKQWQKECHILPGILQDTQTRLERSVMVIKDHFPVVTYAIYRVTSLIEAVIQNK